MTQCKRCENAGINTPGKCWVSFSDNVRWFVCEQCAIEIKWANSRLKQFDRELSIIIQERGAGRKRFEEETK